MALCKEESSHPRLLLAPFLGVIGNGVGALIRPFSSSLLSSSPVLIARGVIFKNFTSTISLMQGWGLFCSLPSLSPFFFILLYLLHSSPSLLFVLRCPVTIRRDGQWPLHALVAKQCSKCYNIVEPFCARCCESRECNRANLLLPLMGFFSCKMP